MHRALNEIICVHTPQVLLDVELKGDLDQFQDKVKILNRFDSKSSTILMFRFLLTRVPNVMVMMMVVSVAH
jgi:hypothetical protein